MRLLRTVRSMKRGVALLPLALFLVGCASVSDRVDAVQDQVSSRAVQQVASGAANLVVLDAGVLSDLAGEPRAVRHVRKAASEAAATSPGEGWELRATDIPRGSRLEVTVLGASCEVDVVLQAGEFVASQPRC